MDGFLATAGTGRHRGSHADEEHCSPGGDLSGHGRHRRTARPFRVPPAEATDGRRDAVSRSLTAG
jgi:hypothetical protein